jgi:NADH:ubiquinone oxidoreductase subunit F (NADH-binding)
MKDGKKIAAVALSGPSGGLLPPKIPVDKLGTRSVPAGTTEIDVRDLPLDINVARKINFMLGAGIVIYGEGCDVLSEAVANSRFFRNESCGKCVPCRIGSEKITEMGEQLLSGKIKAKDVAQVDEIAEQLSYVMRETSICGLGQVASNPLRSILRFFPESLPDT